MTRDEFLQEVAAWLPDNDIGAIEPEHLRYLFTLLGRDSNLVEFANSVGITLFYGVEWDKTAANSAATRIGNMELHRTLPIHNKMRGCLLLDNGKVNYYLHPDDWAYKADGTPSDLTGAHGQVMVEVPSHYSKLEEEGNIQRIKLSDYPLPGFMEVKRFYISAYHTTLNRETNIPASVVNLTPIYRGGNNNAEFDATSKSFLGKSAMYNSIPWTISKYRGIGWHMGDFYTYNVIAHLYLVEYANRDVRLAYNNITEQGLKQGGLGLGVTTLVQSNLSTFNGITPFLPVGVTNSLGNGIGQVAYNMPAEYPVATTVQVPRYRGLENPFGYFSQALQGCARLGEGGQNYLYFTRNPSQFTLNEFEIKANWERVPISFTTATFLKEAKLQAGCLLPVVGGGSTNTFYTDSANNPYTVAAYPVMFGMYGGHAMRGAEAGLFTADYVVGPSLSSVSYRLVTGLMYQQP